MDLVRCNSDSLENELDETLNPPNYYNYEKGLNITNSTSFSRVDMASLLLLLYNSSIL